MSARVLRFAVAAMALAAGSAQAAKPLLDSKDMQDLARGTQLLGGVLESFRQNRPMAPIERQRWAYGVVQQPRLEQSLDQVLQELRRAAGPKAPQARVYVIPDPSFQAYAAEDGSIFIAMGMLESLESCDELAALIAHEYAHVLRGHTGKSSLESAKGMAAGLTSMYLDHEYGRGAGDASRPGTAYMREALLRETAMQSVQAGIVPTRARKQEDEADRLGTDLMAAAGYNPVGMVDLLGRMEAWEAQRREAGAAPQAAQRQSAGVSGTLSRYLQNTQQARNAGRKVDDKDLVNGLIGAVVGGAGSGVQRASRMHQDASQRVVRTGAYIEGAHLERPDMRPLPWQQDAQVQALFASVAQVHQLLGSNDPRLVRPGREQAAMLQQLATSPAGSTPLGRYAALRFLEPGLGSRDALPQLQQELQRQDSLFAAHQLALELVSRSGDRDQALQVLEVSRRSLGDPPELLPYGVRLNRRAGNAEAAQVYAVRCAGSGDDRLKRACLEEL